jgi:hypothetical protein
MSQSKLSQPMTHFLAATTSSLALADLGFRPDLLQAVLDPRSVFPIRGFVCADRVFGNDSRRTIVFVAISLRHPACIWFNAYDAFLWCYSDAFAEQYRVSCQTIRSLVGVFDSLRILSKNGRRCLLDPAGLTEFVKQPEYGPKEIPSRLRPQCAEISLHRNATLRR